MRGLGDRSDDLRDAPFELCGRAYGGIAQAVAIGIDRIDGDMQEPGDLAAGRDAQPDRGQQPQFGIEGPVDRFQAFLLPEKCVRFRREVGIERKERPVELLEKRTILLLDG